MPKDSELDKRIVEDLIAGRNKKSDSYHSDYAKKTYGEIKRLAKAKPPDPKARRMKKLVEDKPRLQDKARKPRR